ncbi:MAG: M64 family metallopeptidase [Paludibacter sp.]|nr:M64 family metallopeptidase [Paludibacter sp.]
MRKVFTGISLLLFFIIGIQAQNYSDYFTEKACRIDFMFCGNDTITTAFLNKIKQEPYWGGRRQHLSEFLNLGEYRFQVTDSLSEKLIYTDGFSTLYFEWQTSDEAKYLQKGFEQSVQFPYPKKAVKISIEKRLGFDQWEPLLQFGFNPQDKLIRRNSSINVPVKEICKATTPEHAVDIAVIAEGYTAAERIKFYKDAQKLAENLFTHEPFKTYKSRINVYAIAAASQESGISMPQDNVWKNTAVGSHYYTFYEPRYLTSPNVFTIRDYASLVPYDAIYVLANTSTYGGGGIYNFYALASAGSKQAQTEVVVHEFGHSFAGLGDEYFYDKDVLDDMYDIKEEPWEPNLTSLVHFEKKWKNMLDKDTLIPTPVNDETKKLSVGVFEGGGYLSKGMYRPAYDCRMRTNEAPAFCPVCKKAVERMILFLTE